LATVGAVIIERESVVDAPADRVWARVVTPAGINDEMRPWMTMSMPRGREDLTVETVPVGTPVGRCWLRLFGVIPFDYDDLTIAELWPGRGFDEQSTMLSMRSWRHVRTLEADGDTKTLVRDRITFELKAPLRPLTPLLTIVLRSFFGHRQRRLQRFFVTR
jgi:ligand-binding SRPBCC domain-containing protein